MSTYETYKNILNKSGIKLLIEEKDFISSQNKYDVQCEKEHVWNVRLNNLLSKGLKRASKGCPHCAKEITDKLSDDAVDRNLLDGHKVISYQMKLTEIKKNRKERFYKIQCPHSHIYEKKSSKMQEGCPKCSTGVFVGEERIKVIFETHFGKEFKKVRPEWLTNPHTQAKMELDGYNHELKIAFEYQGRQHYSNKTQFAGVQAEQSARDNLKLILCKKNNVQLYVIDQPSSYSEDKFAESVISQLEQQGLSIKEMNFCFKKINQDASLQNKYDEFKKLVNEQDINLVSTSLSTMEDELDFKCEEGHLFKMNGLKFKEIIKGNKGRNYFCISCNDNVGVKEVINLETVKSFAQSINYQLLSTSYKGVNEPMDWICNNGHKITKNYRSFQRSKTKDYCEECAKSIKKVHSNVETQFKTASGGVIDLKTVKEFANSIGYQLVSTNYHNVNEKMHWICNNGHNVHKSYRQFQRNQTGNYCEECLKENPSLKVKVVSSTQFKAKDGDIIDLNAVKGFAASIGFQLLADTYNNVNEKMHWICNKGHDVHKSYRQFQRNKTGNYCDECKK